MEHARPKRKQGVDARKLDSEWILYDAPGGTLHVLNEVAHFVWERCDGENTVEKIGAMVSETFTDVPEMEELLSDIRDIVKSFIEAGVLD